MYSKTVHDQPQFHSLEKTKKMQHSKPELPVNRRVQDHPIGRRHSARHYAHWVKESLTTRVSKLICSIFLGLLAIVGLITFILWLSLRPHRPRIFLNDFNVPALGHGGNGGGLQGLTMFSNLSSPVTYRNSRKATIISGLTNILGHAAISC